MTPGEYQALPMADYLKIPAIGSGVICAMVERCPAAAWYLSYLNPHRPQEPSKAADAGSLAHEIVLEDCESSVCVIDPKDHPTEKTRNIPDGWTNKSIKAARDEARAAGKIPVLLEQWGLIKAMADATRSFIDSLRTTEPAVWRAFQTGGESELTGVWEDGGTLCRIRNDRVSLDRDIDINLKYVGRSAQPEAFARSGLISAGYATAAGWYRRGMRALYGTDATTLWIVTEQEPPHLTSLVGLDPQFTAWADARAARGLREWHACEARGVWPGYPSRVAYAELPPWEATKFEEEEIEAPFGHPYDPAVLFKRSA